MKFLFDLGHPAHVHLFRNAARTLLQRGHEITISIRDKPIIKDLLRWYGFEPILASTPRRTVPGLAWELLEHDFNVFRLTRKHSFDVLVGTSAAVAHVSRLTNAKSVVFSEDDARVVRLFSRITYPFADKVVVPLAITDEDRKNYIRHPSYHELAYLHPNHYEPDWTVRDELGVAPGEEYSIVRLVAFGAHHDIGEEGLGLELQTRIVQLLSRCGRVFVTAEGQVPRELRKYQLAIPPQRMHDALAFARILVTDSQTMTAEAAVLGTPAVRCNSFVGRLAYLDELEQRYGLAFGFLPSQGDQMLDIVEQLAKAEDLYGEWQAKRRRMLQDKQDFHSWMVALFESMDE